MWSSREHRALSQPLLPKEPPRAERHVPMSDPLLQRPEGLDLRRMRPVTGHARQWADCEPRLTSDAMRGQLKSEANRSSEPESCRAIATSSMRPRPEIAALYAAEPQPSGRMDLFDVEAQKRTVHSTDESGKDPSRSAYRPMKAIGPSWAHVPIRGIPPITRPAYRDEVVNLRRGRDGVSHRQILPAHCPGGVFGSLGASCPTAV